MNSSAFWWFFKLFNRNGILPSGWKTREALPIYIIIIIVHLLHFYWNPVDRKSWRDVTRSPNCICSLPASSIAVTLKTLQSSVRCTTCPLELLLCQQKAFHVEVMQSHTYIQGYKQLRNTPNPKNFAFTQSPGNWSGESWPYHIRSPCKSLTIIASSFTMLISSSSAVPRTLT